MTCAAQSAGICAAAARIRTSSRQRWRRHMSAPGERHSRTVLTGIVGDTLQPIARDIPIDEPPELPPNSELRVIGKRVNRVDAVPKVTGQARYTFDVRLP